LFRVWYKPSAPIRPICLQDIMNEVFAGTWHDLTDAFNFQLWKHFHDPFSSDRNATSCHASLIHGKICHLRRRLNEETKALCLDYDKDIMEMWTIVQDIK
jgi:hypothetical protein